MTGSHFIKHQRVLLTGEKMKHSIRISLSVMILFVLITSFAYSAKTDWFAKGQDEFNAGNYTKAVDYWKRVANSNIQAANKLGFMYENGLGIERNYKSAKEYYSKAAAQGLDEAKMNLGLLLLFRYSEPVKEGRNNFDIGVEYIMEANSWIKKQVEAGNARAQAALSVLYKKGITVPQDYEQSYKLAYDSAVQECAEGQCLLGNRLSNGEGCKKDLIKAKMYWENAAAQGVLDAQDSLGWLYWEGNDDGTIQKQENLAFYWFEKAAEQGWAISQYCLGRLYYKGVGVAQDYCKARSWYEKAALQGDFDACNSLGYMWNRGEGGVQNDVTAKSWFEKAAAGGNPLGEGNLGLCYENGWGTSKDYYKAREWYEKSANHGDPCGMYCLGECYYFGRGCAKNLEKAKEWMEKAAKGDPDSSNLAEDYIAKAKEFLNTKF